MRALVFAASASRRLAATATLSRLFAFACVLALAAVPAHGASKLGVRVLEPGDNVDHDVPAKPRDLDVRATQINRCPDGRGGVRLQDRPCAPVETPVAAAAATTASAAAQPDVIDLSALPPRARAGDGVAPGSTTAAASEKPSTLRSMRDGALRLVAFVVALYAVWRLGRWLLARREERLPNKATRPPAARTYGRPAPRPRAVTRRPERRRGSRSPRSS